VQGAVGAHNKVGNGYDMSLVMSRHQESVNDNTSEGSNSLDILQNDRLAAADTGHRRIVIFRTSGRIEVMAACQHICESMNSNFYVINLSYYSGI